MFSNSGAGARPDSLPPEAVIASADTLCDDLLEHVFGCEDCLDGSLAGKTVICPVYWELKSRIAATGDRPTPKILAF